LLNQISFIFYIVDEKRIDTNINYVDVTNIAGFKVDRSMNGGPDYRWPKLRTAFFSNSGLLGNQHWWNYYWRPDCAKHEVTSGYSGYWHHYAVSAWVSRTWILSKNPYIVQGSVWIICCSMQCTEPSNIYSNPQWSKLYTGRISICDSSASSGKSASPPLIALPEFQLFQGTHTLTSNFPYFAVSNTWIRIIVILIFKVVHPTCNYYLDMGFYKRLEQYIMWIKEKLASADIEVE
jgi:hypothetical protein